MSTKKSTATKSAATKSEVSNASTIGEAYAVLKTELKSISDAKRQRKTDMLKKIDAMWKEYQAYTKNVYKVKRAAAIAKFEAFKKDAAEKRAEKKAAEKPATEEPAETAAA